MKLNRLSLSLALAAMPALVFAADPVDFTKQVKPVLEQHCVRCHGAEQKKGGLRLHTHEAALAGGDSGAVLVPGKSGDSPLYKLTLLPDDDEKVMPPRPKNARLTTAETEVLKNWIDQGAAWPAGLTLAAVTKVDFVKHIQPILEFNCVACHRDGHKKGGLRLDEKKLAFAGGDSGPGIVPGKPKESPVYTATAVSTNDERLMPPLNKNGPLKKEEIDLLSAWIEQGAEWPEGLTLTPKKKEEAGADELAVTANIHKFIVSKSSAVLEAEMKPYKKTIPGTQVQYSMTPIKGGEFMMGSPAAEAGRNADEGPQHKVKIAPFWMGTYEVTWSEYELFMYRDEERKFKKEIPTDPHVDTVSDAVARPTQPYVEMSFGMGKDDYPAISMTHHAANKFCQWLSAKTGEYYRLPTEAEWEYACRAGTTTKYSFGDDESQLGQYAWFEKNSDFKYQKVGRKKPNPWGLYDMHGNVAEWTADGYDPKAYETAGSGTADSPFSRGTQVYPHVVRGGAWDLIPQPGGKGMTSVSQLRSGARIFSHKSWKQQDPQLPKSIWYLTDAQFLGLRIVRPLKMATPEEMHKAWNDDLIKE